MGPGAAAENLSKLPKLFPGVEIPSFIPGGAAGIHNYPTGEAANAGKVNIRENHGGVNMMNQKKRLLNRPSRTP